VADLPARNIAEVHLAAFLGGVACPICSARAASIASFVDAFLYESVNDVGFRRELDDARGFCEEHTHLVLRANRRQSGGLGAAILFGAILAIRVPELEEARQAAGRSRRRRLDAAARPAQCPVCAHGRTTQYGTVDQLRRLAADPSWRDAIAAAHFCVAHVIDLMRDGPHNADWRIVEEHQARRLRSLRERIASFAAHSSYDRRAEMTEDERRAIDEAASALGGLPPGSER
jgi:hypothetical protein